MSAHEADVCLRNVRIVRPGIGIERGDVCLTSGRIEAVGRCPHGPERPQIDGDGATLTPGLIDMHTHGIKHYRYDVGPEEFALAAGQVGAYGCTCVLPTLLGKSDSGFLELLERTVAGLDSVRGAAIPGLHLEGPFLAHTGAGCTLIPADLGLLRELLAAAAQRVSVMSISPDVENIIPVIEYLVSVGVVPFITHTLATLEQTQRAIAAGARHATHFYDVFYPQPETDLGVRPVACVEAILADRRVTADFICDGVHVDPTAIRMTLYAKGWENVMLISDSNVGAGLPAGEYDTPWGFRIYVHPDKAARIIGDHKFAGALAGSALTMNRGIANLMRWFGDEYAEEQIWAMATSNPARLLGLQQKGRIEPGADADLVLWGEGFEPRLTWVGGHIVYSREHV